MFIYYNANPTKDDNVGDCVIRAISLALDTDYDVVVRLLINNSNYFNCDLLVRDCYGKLLDDLGYKRYYGNGRTVKEVAEDYFDKKLVVRVPSHAVACLYGDVFDTWNSSYEPVDCFWVIE